MTLKAEIIQSMARSIQDVKGGLNYDYADFCRDAATAAFTACMERLKGDVPTIDAAVERALVPVSNQHWGRAKISRLSMIAAIEGDQG